MLPEGVRSWALGVWPEGKGGLENVVVTDCLFDLTPSPALNFQVMVNEERLVSLFKELCLIDAPALGEGACVAHVKSFLEGMGLEVREDDAGRKIGGNGNNVIAWL